MKSSKLFRQLMALETLKWRNPHISARGYTLIGICHHQLGLDEWETNLRKGLALRDPMAARYMATIACRRGEWNRAKAFLRYAKRIS